MFSTRIILLIMGTETPDERISTSNQCFSERDGGGAVVTQVDPCGKVLGSCPRAPPLSRLPVSEGGPWCDPPVRDVFLCKSLSLFSSLIESISKF